LLVRAGFDTERDEMPDSGFAFAVYVGIGVLVAVAIFAAAFWFANAARKGSMRFARRQRSARNDERDPGRTDERSRTLADETKGLRADE